MLEKSSKLKVERTQHLSEQMQRLKGTYRRLHLAWVVPATVERAMQLHAPMLRRYKKGDYRHSLEEAQAEEDVAVWLANQHAKAYGLPLIREATWVSPWLDKRKRKLITA